MPQTVAIESPADVFVTPLRLDVNLVRELWSKTYNSSGKPDWSHLYPYYHPQVVFQDSIQRIEGLDEFKAMCSRLTDRCQSLAMDIINIAQQDHIIFLEWKMTMSFNKYPSTPVMGCTRLQIHDDGRIIHQRDYFDLWGDIFNGIPYFVKQYRRFMKKHFG